MVDIFKLYARVLKENRVFVNSFNEIFAKQFFFIFPLLMIPSVFFFLEESIFETIKLIEFFFFILFVFFNLNKELVFKYSSVLMLIILNIIITTTYRSIDDLLNMIVRIVPFLTLFISPFAFINIKRLIRQITLYNLVILFLFIILILVLPTDDVYRQKDLSSIIGLRLDQSRLKLPFLFSDNLHNTTYLIMILIIPFFYLRNYKSYIGILFGLILLSLYTVRVTQLTLLLSLSYYLICHIHKIQCRKVIIWCMIFTSIMSIFYLSISFDILLLDKFLSGRISAWSNMLDIYYNYDFLEKLFGKGYGSDFFYQDVWRGIKNSHSCFLEYLFIGGFLSVLLLLDILVKIGRSSMFILLIVLLLSAFSNGLMYMPIHFMYFMFLCKFISTQISDPWNYYCNKNKLK